MNRIAIFGIDGGSLELIERWKDDLPNLRQIMENGVYGELESTLPPVTCPAWPCMFTGKNPGKLGLYGFTSVKLSGENRTKIHSSLDYNQQSLWKILNDYGIPVGIFNLPMTFPPHKVNSFMVCGTGSPVTGRANYTYPTWLKKELNKVVPGYEVLPPIVLTTPGKEAAYKSALEQSVRNRLKAAKYLINAFPWQLWVGVFYSLDSVQHYFWHHMDNTHPRHSSGRYRHVIKDFYQKIDAAVGELVKELPPETNLLIVSDHGFGPCHGNFVISKWLERQGFLTFLPPETDRTKLPWLWRLRDFLLSILGIRIASLIARALPVWLSIKISIRQLPGYKVAQIYRTIDWARTKAYPAGAGMITVNLKGREPSGIVEPGQEHEKLVDDIVGRLKELTEPGTGEPLDVAAFKRDEIYHGQYANQGPDIAVYIEKYIPVVGRSQQPEWDKPVHSGWHTRQGMFMASGPDIRRSGTKLNNLKIYSIAPTVLHMFGLPVPRDMDGRVLTEIFNEASEPGQREVVYQEIDYEAERVKRKVRELKRLGRL